MDKATSDLIAFADLKEGQVMCRRVPIDDDATNYINTFVMESEPSLPRLVMIHGYGASGALLYKVWKHLQPHFNLYVIDLVGMGSSTRPRFDCTTGESADEYMIFYIEKWRVAMNNMTDFILSGNSYAGYLAGTYALRYP